MRSAIELLAKLVVSTPERPDDTLNAALDAQIQQAIAELVMPELPAARPALEADVVDAEVVPEPAP